MKAMCNTLAYITAVLFLVHLVSSENKLRRFKRSSVINETCDLTSPINETTVREKRFCFFNCLQNKDCKRLMVCPTGGEYMCSLYTEGGNCVSPLADCECHRQLPSCNKTTCLCPRGYSGNKCEYIAKSCSDAGSPNLKLMFVIPEGETLPIEVLCEEYMTVIIVRQRTCSTNIFQNRSYSDYKRGFGNIRTQYFVGLDNLVNSYPWSGEWMPMIETFDGRKCGYKYLTRLGNSSTDFEMSMYGSNNAFSVPGCFGDFDSGAKYKFSHISHDPYGKGCPEKMGAAGWFKDNINYCTYANYFGAFNATHFDMWSGSQFSNGEIRSFRIIKRY